MTTWKMLVCRAVMFSCIFLALHRRLYPIALLIGCVFQLYFICLGYPLTGNHKYVELYILLLLLVSPDRPNQLEESAGSERSYLNNLADGTCSRLIGMLALSIYFYSGLQKLANGRWHTGEYLTLTLFHQRDFGLPVSLSMAVDWIASFGGLVRVDYTHPMAKTIERVPLDLPHWVTILILLLSWFTIISETGLPLLVIFRRTRKIGLLMFLLMSIMIGLVSWETEFMFLLVGSVLLFYPRHAVINYITLMVLHLMWSFYVHIVDIRIWIL